MSTLIGVPTIGASGYLPALLTELAGVDADVPVILVCNGTDEDRARVEERVAAATELPWLIDIDRVAGGIYASWNHVLEVAAAGGHRVAVILNDNVFIDHWSIKAAERAIGDGYTIVGWDPDADPARRPAERQVVDVHGAYREHGVTGFAFALDLRAGVRCDERFGWWGGDDDLVYTITARSLRAGKMVGVGIQHWPSTSSRARPEVLASLEADRALLLAKHGRTW